MEKKSYKSINFLGHRIFSSDMSELLAFLLPSKNSKRAEMTQLVSVFTPNPEQIVEAQDNLAFRSHLAQADILIPDGIGLITAQKVMQALGKSKEVFTQRITGTDLAQRLLLEAHQRKWSVLVVGGRDYLRYTNSGYRVQNVDKAWLASFTELNPTTNREQGTGNRSQVTTNRQRVTGHRSQVADVSSNSNKKPLPTARDLLPVYWLEGYQDVKNPTAKEETFVAQVLKTVHPDIVFVAFGAPYQEQWVIEHKTLLESSNVKIAMVVGGAFDVILGKLNRAPVFMQKLGFEWLFRLLQEPHRWKRQLKLITFMKLVVQKLVS